MPAGLRNIVIILALAAVLAFVPGGGTTGEVVLQILSIAFLAGFLLLAYRMYREHRVALFSLGDRNRGVLYASTAAMTLALVGASRLLDTGPGVLVWFALVVGSVVGLISVVRAVREY